MVVSMAPADGYAVALDLCPLDTAAPLGIALIVPSKRTLLMMADGAGIASVVMPDETWREIDAWIAEGNARLPKQPPPLTFDRRRVPGRAVVRRPRAAIRGDSDSGRISRRTDTPDGESSRPADRPPVGRGISAP
jgi:hypothetical protein